MSDDYGYTTDPLDVEIGIYALRTFSITNGQLGSVVLSRGHWQDGVCLARRIKGSGHEAPAAECNCGIYGTHTLGALFRQYPQYACRIVGVIAAEGTTYVGSVGLRTAAARVVAFWCAEPDDQHPNDAEICAAQCPGARRFFNARVMAKLYGLGE